MSKTYGEQFKEALACENQAEAAVWLENEIARYQQEYGKTYEEARRTIAVNLGARYVRVPPGHPMHSKHYDDVPVEVHGGLTFGRIEPCAHEDGTGYWFGFDCAHYDDASYDPLNLPDYQREFRAKHPEFDHLHEMEHYWTQREVEIETERLARQLAEIT
jgi:hypothetical protein